MEKVNWDLIEEEYVGTAMSLRAIAAAHGVSTSTLHRHAQKGGWRAAREERLRDVSALFRGEGAETPAGLDPDAALLRVTGKLLRRAEELADEAGEMNARELGELMRAVKSASAIRLLHGTEEGESSDTLSVCFSPEAEEASQ